MNKSLEVKEGEEGEERQLPGVLGSGVRGRGASIIIAAFGLRPVLVVVWSALV